MTEYQRVTGTGDTSESGSTTRVGARSGLAPKDEAHLCSIICSCNQTPTVGVILQKLKQQCVSKKLAQDDAAMGYQSPYKAEVNYDMSMTPPAPIVDSATETRSHTFLPGWIQKYWPGGLAGYEPGRGNIRRPDVVIVNDPAVAPVQSNIKQLVEIKFQGDSYGRGQLAAYRRIAGSRSKVSTLSPDTCGCDDQESESKEQSQNASDSVQSGAAMFRKAMKNAQTGPFGGPPLWIPAAP